MDCRCKQNWEYDVGDGSAPLKCSNGETCCNPDNDDFGDWCIVEDPECEESDFGYCRPLSMAVQGCTDFPPSWTDSEGDACYSYSVLSLCTSDGHSGSGWRKEWGTFQSFTSNGYDASEACCACGGGSFTNQGYNAHRCADKVDWEDKDGDGCYEYGLNNWCTDDGEPGPGWHTEDWGQMSLFTHNGASALEACCVCGGGGKGTGFPTTSYDPWFGGWWEEPDFDDDDTTGVVAPSHAMWSVASGGCTIDAQGCALSPNYPAPYKPNEKCVIGINKDKIVPVTAVEFETEWGYDVLKVNAISYSGSAGPEGITPWGPIIWTSDSEEVDGGWKLCPEAASAGSRPSWGPAPSPEGGTPQTGVTEGEPEGKHKMIGSAVAVVLALGVASGAYFYCKRGKKDTGLGDMPTRGHKYGRQDDDV